jgi:hypothetical protein
MNDALDVVTGSVGVVDGRIAFAGEIPAAQRDVRYDETVDAAGAYLLPGFVQTHIHLCQTLFRSMADDLPLRDWLRARVWPLEAAHDPSTLRVSARLAAAELLKGGTTTVLSNGVALTGQSASTGSWKHYKIAVPASQTSLAIVMSGGTGDGDLYVKRGAQPTSSSYDYRPYLNGNNETVNVTNPVAGDWYISLYAYSTYASVTLKATYTGSTGGGCTSASAVLSGTGANSYQPSSSGYVSSVSGNHTATLTGPSGTDFDLYLQKWNGSSWASVKASEGTTSTESITYAGTSGTYRWRVYAYSGSGTYTICTTKP